MAVDVARVRGLFPALGDGWVHLDTLAGMQVPEGVATVVSTALRAPVSGPGGIFPASQRAEAILGAARRSVADLLGADPAGVVLGPNSAELLQRLANAVSESWTLGDEVIISRLDHPSNIEPWRRVAQRAGAAVRWAEIDIENCELPAWQYENLLTPRTKVVAVTAASDTVGTRPDIRAISEYTRPNGALLVVDATSAAPFLPLTMESLGADVVAVSASAWGGPPVAALAFRDPSLIERLPSAALIHDASGPGRLEVGPYAYPLLAGLVASVDYLAALDDSASGTRRERLRESLGAMKAYQAGLLTTLLFELRLQRHIHVVGDAMRRVPVVAFTVESVKAADVVEHLAQRGVCAFADTGAVGVFGALGVGEVGGAVRLGLAHYTNAEDVHRLVSALAELA
jgi:cysteine desulfurase family protein (TIGR01976 family)